MDIKPNHAAVVMFLPMASLKSSGNRSTGWLTPAFTRAERSKGTASPQGERRRVQRLVRLPATYT